MGRATLPQSTTGGATTIAGISGLQAALDAKADSSALSGKADAGIAGLPAGAVISVVKSGTWPARPTTRTDLRVMWIGAAPSPSIVTSPSTGGMYDTDLRVVTP